MATANITYRGIDYSVIGHISPAGRDHGGDGIIVRRCDGRPIRGTKMLPGQLQTGVSDQLVRLAEAAIVAALETA